LGEKERKNTSEGKKKRKETKIRAFSRPSLELSPFMLSQLSNGWRELSGNSDISELRRPSIRRML